MKVSRTPGGEPAKAPNAPKPAPVAPAAAAAAQRRAHALRRRASAAGPDRRRRPERRPNARRRRAGAAARADLRGSPERGAHARRRRSGPGADPRAFPQRRPDSGPGRAGAHPRSRPERRAYARGRARAREARSRLSDADVGHVEKALRTTLEENLAMVRDTVSHLRAEGQQVFLDAEHFFDGYRLDRAYALEVLRTAYDAGADVVALCDTNGGMLPAGSPTSSTTVQTTGVRVGHPLPQRHRVRGRQHPRRGGRRRDPRPGCINGYGERTGNADLVNVVANLERSGPAGLPPGLLAEATRIAHAVAEVTNVPPASRQPYVGVSAFAHKAGLHASAIKIDPDLSST